MATKENDELAAQVEEAMPRGMSDPYWIDGIPIRRHTLTGTLPKLKLDPAGNPEHKRFVEGQSGMLGGHQDIVIMGIKMRVILYQTVPKRQPGGAVAEREYKLAIVPEGSEMAAVPDDF